MIDKIAMYFLTCMMFVLIILCAGLIAFTVAFISCHIIDIIRTINGA